MCFVQTPRVELDEIGPSMDLSFRRTHEAAQEVQKAAMRKPKELKARKIKNVSTGNLGHNVGRIHMHRQDLGKIALKKQRGHSYKRRKLEKLEAKQTAEKQTSDALLAERSEEAVSDQGTLPSGDSNSMVDQMVPI